MRLAFFLYAREEARFHVADLLVEPGAIKIAQLGQDRECFFAGDLAHRDAPPVCARRSRERKREERVLIVTTVWLTLEQIQLVGVLFMFGAGLLLRKSP
jgi:hypothetical protein